MSKFGDILQKIRNDVRYVKTIEEFAVMVLSAVGVGASSIAIGDAVINGAIALVNGFETNEDPAVTDAKLKQIAADLDAGLTDLHKQEDAALDAKFPATPVPTIEEPKP